MARTRTAAPRRKPHRTRVSYPAAAPRTDWPALARALAPLVASHAPAAFADLSLSVDALPPLAIDELAQDIVGPLRWTTAADVRDAERVMLRQSVDRVLAWQPSDDGDATEAYVRGFVRGEWQMLRVSATLAGKTIDLGTIEDSVPLDVAAEYLAERLAPMAGAIV